MRRLRPERHIPQHFQIAFYSSNGLSKYRTLLSRSQKCRSGIENKVKNPITNNSNFYVSADDTLTGTNSSDQNDTSH